MVISFLECPCNFLLSKRSDISEIKSSKKKRWPLLSGTKGGVALFRSLYGKKALQTLYLSLWKVFAGRFEKAARRRSGRKRLNAASKESERKVCFISPVSGHTVCVLCDGKALQEDLGGRCKGHGVEDETTRFKNLLNPRCHGKWTRIQVSEGECPCRGGSDFVFV